MFSVPLGHILSVSPLIALKAVYDRGVCRPSLRVKGIGVGFETYLIVSTCDNEAVDIALTYTGENKTVRIRQEDIGSRVRVSVSDSGEGIPADELPYIWDRYYRANSIDYSIKNS